MILYYYMTIIVVIWCTTTQSKTAGQGSPVLRASKECRESLRQWCSGLWRRLWCWVWGKRSLLYQRMQVQRPSRMHSRQSSVLWQLVSDSAPDPEMLCWRRRLSWTCLLLWNWFAFLSWIKTAAKQLYLSKSGEVLAREVCDLLWASRDDLHPCSSADGVYVWQRPQGDVLSLLLGSRKWTRMCQNGSVQDRWHTLYGGHLRQWHMHKRK